MKRFLGVEQKKRQRELLKINDYVLYDRANNTCYKWSYGDIVLYADKNEAMEDCYGNEEVVQVNDLPYELKQIIINQITK